MSDVYQRFADKLGDGAGSASSAPVQEAARPLALEPGMEVIMGADAEGDDRAWLETTLANLNVVRGQRGAAVNPLRPTPETAKLAYLMLAGLGA